MIDWLHRVVYGPAPPAGKPHMPWPSLRCRVGLHLWADVWNTTRVESGTDQDGFYEATFVLNLDRPPDYEGCERCHAKRNIRGQDG